MKIENSEVSLWKEENIILEMRKILIENREVLKKISKNFSTLVKSKGNLNQMLKKMEEALNDEES